MSGGAESTGTEFRRTIDSITTSENAKDKIQALQQEEERTKHFQWKVEGERWALEQAKVKVASLNNRIHIVKEELDHSSGQECLETTL